MFHMFGHALHYLFSQVKYSSLVEAERNFVELPSQMMENWALRPEMLRVYAVHNQTGEPISEDLIRRIQQQQQFNQGISLTHLLAMSFLDQDLYAIAEYQAMDLDYFDQAIVLPGKEMHAETTPQFRNGHFSPVLNGKNAVGAYGWIWSEMLDEDAFEAFVESGDIFNPKVADAFRRMIMAPGGSQNAMELYKQFRGKEPTIRPMMIDRGLIKPRGASPDSAKPKKNIVKPGYAY